MKICKRIFYLSCFISPFFCSAQQTFITTALNAADNTGYRQFTYQKPGVYFAIGRSNDVDYFREGKFNFALAFSQKGAFKAPNPAKGDYIAYNVRLNYAELNLNYWLKVKSIKAIVGLNAGYLINSSERGVAGVAIQTGYVTPYKKTDFSFMAGAGALLGQQFMVHLTGTYSIFPIRYIGGTASPTVAFANGPRNSLFSIGFTYIFKKKEEPEAVPDEE
ncbi:MAG TPA: hypothetical protein VD905_09550 [Flavobacteriales bacterium]|nr:hypothetical protein [Flavobacteriales bacterium]